MLDSLRLSLVGNLPEATGFSADLSRFRAVTDPVLDPQTGEIVDQRTYYQQNQRGRMGGYFRYFPQENEWLVEFDAKTLWQDYPQGISEHTIGAALAQIERANDVRFYMPQEFISRARVCRADVAANVAPAAGVPATIAACRAALRWNRKQTDYRFSESLLFYNTREEMNFYDKAGELKAKATDPQSRQLLKLVQKEVQGKLRVEYRAKKTDIIAKKFEQDWTIYTNPTTVKNRDVRLNEVLSRRLQKKALMDSFASMSIAPQPAFGVSLESLFQCDLTPIKMARALGAKALLDLCGSETTLAELCRAKTSAGASARSEKRRILEMAAICAGLDGKKAIDIIQELQEKLEAA